MKHLTKIFATLVMLIFVAGNIYAQSEEHPLLVVSFQKVKMTDIGAANKLINDSIFIECSYTLDDGLIYNWYSITPGVMNGM